MQGIVLTASEEFLATAIEELQQKFPQHKQVTLGPGLLWLETGAEHRQQVHKQLIAKPPIFVRHLYSATMWPVSSQPELIASVSKSLLADLPSVPLGASVAVQARAVNTTLDWQPRDLKAACDSVLCEQGYQPTIKDPQWVVSVTQARQAVYYGLAPASHNLSDWTGGMLHFRKEPGDVSRAKFKLLEAIIRFGLHFPHGGKALDLGAAPGGWTQELLARGLAVVAVDTGELDPRLNGVKGLRFLQMNVKDLRFSPLEQFDLITCDMSWDPIFTAKLVNGLVNNLSPGGQVVMTVKLMGKRPLPTIQRVLTTLDQRLEVSHAQHLWHNRQEITLHLIRTK